MLTRYTIAALAGSALLAGAAFAQTPSTSSPSTSSDHTKMAPAPTADTSSFHGDWRTSKIIGLNVYNDNNASLGSISDLLTDKTGSIKAAVIGVGGFLGVGEHLVAVPFDKIKFVNEPVAYTGVAGAPKSKPMSSTTTTGAATSNTAPAHATPKANPWYPNHAVYNATKDELKAMPEFKYSTN